MAKSNAAETRAYLKQFMDGDDCEYRRWLHVFRAGMNFVNYDKQRSCALKSCKVLPWIIDSDDIDFVALDGLQKLGAFVDYPWEWKNSDFTLRSFMSEYSPVYAVLAYGPSDSAIHDVIHRMYNDEHSNSRRWDYNHPIWDTLQNFIALPRQDGGTLPTFVERNLKQRRFEHESFGLDKVRPRIVRNRRYDTSRWAPWLW